MDAHVFRVIGSQILTLLQHSRVEKIHSPYTNLTVFTCYKNGERFRLGLWANKNYPSTFLIHSPLPNPKQPPAFVMRLRKYLSGLRLGDGALNFSQRSLTFSILKEGKPLPFSLSLDLLRGASIVESIIIDEPIYTWPQETIIRMLCSEGTEVQESLWRDYPLLTPLLRETIRHLSFLDAMALLVDLEAGGGDIFFYANDEGIPTAYTAWPLQQEQLTKKGLVSLPEPFWSATNATQNFFPASLLGTSCIDERLVLASFASSQKKAELSPERKYEKKRKKTLAKIEQEKKRLQSMVEMQEEAKVIQQHLWQYSQDYQAPAIALSNTKGEKQEILLNPRLTLRENMEKMFTSAAKGKRGLAILEGRQKEIHEKQYTGLLSPSLLEKKGNHKEREKEPTTVSTFISCDGYVLLRGKNAKGNQSALKMAQPYDYWLHTQDGPSAHVIIRRAHPNDEPPTSTIEEAARLVAEKSHYKNDSSADIMVCLAKHVHPAKGSPAGSVHIDKVFFQLHTKLLKI